MASLMLEQSYGQTTSYLLCFPLLYHQLKYLSKQLCLTTNKIHPKKTVSEVNPFKINPVTASQKPECLNKCFCKLERYIG